ncbi:MAG: bifunctional riboflavin kinase/FAD synthetase [Myxococcales bacterium]|jgi:riboflavin kinase/FMN adenylyltransferase
MGPATTAPRASDAAIAPGNHDGVHLGHQALVHSARREARAHGWITRALTFDPHPTALLAPERAPTPLTTIARRVELLRHAGADEVLVQPFTHEFAGQSPESFMAWLLDQGARALVVGPDFRFGKGRAGDVESLRRFGADRGFSVLVENKVLVDGERVSSSGVREALAEGDVARARRWLGHVHDVAGEVVRGDRRGRTLGFPTANLDPEPVLLPADGVYAVVARVLGGPRTLLHGIANLGKRPTFEAGRSVEVHLFDFDRDVYGQRLRVGFVERIRGERRFDDVQALRAQIALDCEAARATLRSADSEGWAWI